jgi:hypothetical protein
MSTLNDLQTQSTIVTGLETEIDPPLERLSV